MVLVHRSAVSKHRAPPFVFAIDAYSRVSDIARARAPPRFDVHEPADDQMSAGLDERRERLRVALEQPAGEVRQHESAGDESSLQIRVRRRHARLPRGSARRSRRPIRARRGRCRRPRRCARQAAPRRWRGRPSRIRRPAPSRSRTSSVCSALSISRVVA